MERLRNLPDSKPANKGNQDWISLNSRIPIKQVRKILGFGFGLGRPLTKPELRKLQHAVSKAEGITYNPTDLVDLFRIENYYDKLKELENMNISQEDFEDQTRRGKFRTVDTDFYI